MMGWSNLIVFRELPFWAPPTPLPDLVEPTADLAEVRPPLFRRKCFASMRTVERLQVKATKMKVPWRELMRKVRQLHVPQAALLHRGGDATVGDLIHHLLNLEDGKEEDDEVDEQRNVDGNGDEDQLGEGELTKQIRRPYSGRSREALVAGLNSRLSAVATMASGTRYT
ncbi:hypothetical protein TYRP_005855 [Tyrophagus putrescentiae]|nr:hypothetical protein TYRP_005855 [Tyrophagus putrescentiae]